MPDRLAAVLVRRRGLVSAGLGAEEPRRRRWRLSRRRDSEAGTAVLEVELIARGFLLSAGLHHHCAAMPAERLAGFGKELLWLVDNELGAHVDHVPLFRGFPDTVPHDTTELFVDRMFSVLLQLPEQPCVLCGDKRTVHPVSPCGHLVCSNCWDGSDYSACPICHRRVDPDDPFLRPAAERPAAQGGAPAVEGLRLLVASDDPATDGARLLHELLARAVPPSPRDRDDIRILLDELDGVPGRFPELIPIRESRALVTARHPELLETYADTATDVLRFLFERMGGDPGLRVPPKRRLSLPRALRRTVLARLDALPAPLLIEDMLRHREAWKAMAEGLHPFEHRRRFGVAAMAFALLRRTDLTGPQWQSVRETAARYPELRLVDGRLRITTFGSRVEQALAADRPGEALDLLRSRPGELVRRLVQLARALPAHERTELLDALLEVVSDASPAVLVAAIGQLRTPPGGSRLFFPRGGSTRAWVEPDQRAPIDPELAGELTGMLIAELVRRGSMLRPIGRAFLDERLDELAAPGSERTASATLVRLTRGSTQPVPDDQVLRLFLHWQQPTGVRVDLDLSLALFDERWNFVGLCDYTTLRFEQDALIHSGDLTSAPEPLGASEFVDIDTELVRVLGGRYLLPVVFSYNDVEFDLLERGFAGVMAQPAGLFDPLAVRQRFDLSGPAKILVPFVVDLWESRLRWFDIDLTARGFGHNYTKYAAQLARLAAAIDDVHGAGDRVSLWELSCWHAAGRAAEIAVRTADGDVIGYQRHTGEDLAGFARRVAARREPDVRLSPDAAELADLAAVITGDIDPAPGAEVYALYPAGLDGDRVTLVDAAHLLGVLAPDTRARLAT